VALRSNTSVCLSLDLSAEEVKALTTLLEQQEVAFDIGAYRDAPAGLRIWCGSTIEKVNLETLCVWLEWAYFEVKSRTS
jgi:phosphoserine aminotransferase